MKRVVDYKIAVADDIENLEVKDQLAEDWQPFGAPFQGGKNQSWLLQALVKHEE